MENTTKANNVKTNLTRGIRERLVKNAVLVAAAFLLGHAPLMGEMFPAAIAFLVYMISRDSIYFYLTVPCSFGIFLCISHGCDSWGELVSLIACGVIFAISRKAKLELWQRAAVAAAISVTCVSITRILMSTVYKASIQMLILEGVLIAVSIFLTDAFIRAIEDGEGGMRAVASVSIMFLCVLSGAGASFIMWPAVIFITMCFLVYSDTGNTFAVVIVCGIYAFLAGQTQWGMLITICIGVCVAYFFIRRGIILACAVFVSLCIILRAAEGGVVLGIDNYCLAVGSISFIVLNWKFGKRIRKTVSAFAGTGESGKEAFMQAMRILSQRSSEMKDLSALYSTYVDSRSALAVQFDIAGKIMEETGRTIREQERRRSDAAEKMSLEIGISQCAASGEINGDCCGWEDIGGGKTAMMISDGMGKGKKAASESLMVTKTVMSLLKAGAGADLTLKMINTIMVMKDDGDSFATVDLTVADRRTGRIRFYKTGAAPTLIKRKNSIEEVRLSAVPLGIVNGLKIEYTETFVKKGDMIIMMSDGVSDGGSMRSRGKSLSGIDSVREILKNIKSKNPQTVSDILINHSADSYIGKERDDLTVITAKFI